jgi:hypothetical protein
MPERCWEVVCVFADLLLAAVVTPSGDPTLKPGLDPASVTPGTLGFLATLFIVVAVIFLIRDMVKRVRRVRYAAEVEEVRAQRATDGGGAGPGRTSTGDGAGPDGIRSGRDLPRPGGAHGPDNR